MQLQLLEEQEAGGGGRQASAEVARAASAAGAAATCGNYVAPSLCHVRVGHIKQKSLQP